MSRRKLKINYLFNILIFFTGLSIGIILIWPGILKNQNRRCFLKIIEDGSDGKVSIGTILSIEPNYLLKINNAKSTYSKILLIGDHCFQK
tara:strand:- start:218 stop:487 length:270 start_codon:yes stop_codon:yes gene_type:complete